MEVNLFYCFSRVPARCDGGHPIVKFFGERYFDYMFFMMLNLRMTITFRNYFITHYFIKNSREPMHQDVTKIQKQWSVVTTIDSCFGHAILYKF